MIITVQVNGTKYTGTRMEVAYSLRKIERLPYRQIGAEVGRSREVIGRWMRERGEGLNERIPKPKTVKIKRNYSNLPLRRQNLITELFGDEYIAGLDFETGFVWFFENYFRTSAIVKARKVWKEWNRNPMEIYDFSLVSKLNLSTIKSWIEKNKIKAEQRVVDSKNVWFILDMDEPENEIVTHLKNHYIDGFLYPDSKIESENKQSTAAKPYRYRRIRYLKGMPELMQEIAVQLLKKNAIVKRD